MVHRCITRQFLQGHQTPSQEEAVLLEDRRGRLEPLKELQEAVVMPEDVEPDAPVELAQTDRAEVKVVLLVLDRHTIAAPHQAIEPCAILQAE